MQGSLGVLTKLLKIHSLKGFLISFHFYLTNWKTSPFPPALPTGSECPTENLFQTTLERSLSHLSIFNSISKHLKSWQSVERREARSLPLSPPNPIKLSPSAYCLFQSFIIPKTVKSHLWVKPTCGLRIHPALEVLMPPWGQWQGGREGVSFQQPYGSAQVL